MRDTKITCDLCRSKNVLNPHIYELPEFKGKEFAISIEIKIGELWGSKPRKGGGSNTTTTKYIDEADLCKRCRINLLKEVIKKWEKD